MNSEELKNRTKKLAVRIIRVVEALSNNRISDVLGRQLLRSGTSVGANYRAVCRAKSPSDFINKLKIVEEECDESLYWMELLIEARQMKANRLANLMKETDEILSIIVAAAKTARSSAGARKS